MTVPTTKPNATLKPTHETVVVDGVLRWPSTGLDVLIVGGGPAGYFTALECWRKGHNVRVIEKNPGNSPIGDGLFVGPSAWTTLKYYPTMLQEYPKCTQDVVRTFRGFDGVLMFPPSEFEFNRAGAPEHASWPLRVKTFITRAGMADMFYQQCQRLGIPVVFGVDIVDYLEDSGSATAVARDGQKFTADIIVAADGIGTKSHKVVMGEVIRAVPTGYSICRTKFSLDQERNAKLIKMREGQVERPDMRISSGENYHIVAVLSADFVSFGFTFPDDGKSSEGWAEPITAEQFLSILPDTTGWDPLLIEILHNLPNNSIIKWQLCWRDPQPKWTSAGGRIVQVGDAAHAFIPSSISGAASSLEDAMSQAECLRLAGRDSASTGTKIHEFIRLQRVSILQRMGFSNRREMHRKGGTKEMINNAANADPMRLGKWVWTHNPETYATEKFAQARAHLEENAPFKHTNIPAGFKWEPWTMQDELAKKAQGIETPDIKLNGDWSSE